MEVVEKSKNYYTTEMETLNRNKNDDRSIDERAAFNSKYLVIPVIGELTIRYVGHFNFLDTSRLPIYIQITGTFHFWGGTNVDSLRNPLRSTNRYRCFIFGWRNFTRISSGCVTR